MEAADPHQRMLEFGDARKGWGAHVLPIGQQLSEANVLALRASGELPTLSPTIATAVCGALPWRCASIYATIWSHAGIGCVVRALCSVLACSPEHLGMWRDPLMSMLGGVGSELDFYVLQVKHGHSAP